MNKYMGRQRDITIVQIIQCRTEEWYKKRINQTFEVDYDEDLDLYFLSKKQLKRMKKATHLKIGILPFDCKEVSEHSGKIKTDSDQYTDDDLERKGIQSGYIG